MVSSHTTLRASTSELMSNSIILGMWHLGLFVHILYSGNEIEKKAFNPSVSCCVFSMHIAFSDMLQRVEESHGIIFHYIMK